MASCQDDFTPKPKAQLRLEYPSAKYHQLANDCAYGFLINNFSEIENPKGNQDCWVNINYPKLKGKIHITYRSIDNNLEVLLKDAQDLTQNHTKKADGIDSVVYDNEEQEAYGMIYEIEGNAASPVQFYVTDKKNHFLTGSVYFNTKPNYDSILPAAHYLKKDVKMLMESLVWK